MSLHYGMCPGRQADALRCAALAADECFTRGAFGDCLYFLELAAGLTTPPAIVTTDDLRLVLAIVRKVLAEISPIGVFATVLRRIQDARH